MTLLRSDPKPISSDDVKRSSVAVERPEGEEEEEEEEVDPAVPVGPCALRCSCAVFSEPFGTFQDLETGQEVEATVFTLTCKRKFSVRITDYGATVVGIRAPDCNGVVKDLVFGFDDVQGYVQHAAHLLGGMVGRVAGRVPYARFVLGDAIYNLTENVETDGPCRHHQDGGFHGLQQLRWQAHVPCEGSSLVLSVVHHDEQEGFPGAVLVQLLFRVCDGHRLVVSARADSTKPTLVSLRQGIMLNLAGHDAGPPDLMDHILTINADEYVAQTRRGTPTGETRKLRRTALDFRAPKRLRKQHGRSPAGYDHLLCLNHLPPDALHMVARLEHPESGRSLEIRSNQPCVHVYTGRRLPPWKKPKPRPPTPTSEDAEEEEEESSGTDPAAAAKSKSQQVKTSSTSQAKVEAEAEPHEEAVEEEEEDDENTVRGKDGVRYGRFCGIWLAPAWFPNAICMDRFPKSVLTPAYTYEHVTAYRFFARSRPARYELAQRAVDTSVHTAMDAVDAREEEPPTEADQ